MKKRFSMLDRFAGRIDRWFGKENKPCPWVLEQLHKNGCMVTRSNLYKWWDKRSAKREGNAMLKWIANGSGRAKAVERQFRDCPAPAMDMLINLHRTLIFQLDEKGRANKTLLRQADQMLRTVMKYVSDEAKLKQRNRELKLAEDKFQFNAAEACLQQLPELKAISTNQTLTTKQKIDQIRLKLFGVLAE